MVQTLRARLVKSCQRRRNFTIWQRVGVAVLAFGSTATGLLVFPRSQSQFPKPTEADGSQRHASGAIGVGVRVGVIEGVLLHRNGTSLQRLDVGTNIEVSWDDSLETPLHDGAEVRLSNLVNATLSPQTEVRHMTAHQGQVERISLVRGHIRLHVSRLDEGRRFHVITPFADVQVRGTAFDVEILEILPGKASSTCLRVQQGSVEVTAGNASYLVDAGQTWGCGPTDVGGVASDVVCPTLARATAARLRSPSAAETGALPAQNQLFQQALRAQRANRHGTAAEIYRAFLKRYPDAPLAAQAQANLASIPEAP
jgi:ferric-dicitrate binding protein FerR (iron transport regulator)